MKTAKDLDLGRIEVMIDKAFYNIIEEMKRHDLEGYIREGWENRLNKVQTSISTRLRSCSGRAYWNTRKDEYKIKLHKDLPLNNGTKHKSIKGTIKHEVLHLIMLEGDNKKFKGVCDTLNIEKFHKLNFDTIEEYKYNLICKGCGKVIQRYKRKAGACKRPENYHSNCCKGDLRVERI